MSFRILVLLIVFLIAPAASYAGVFAMCKEAQQKQVCLAPPADIFAKFQSDLCETQKQADGCYELAKENPSLRDKIKNCDLMQSCHYPLNSDGFADACSAAFKQSWTDMVTGVYEFLFKNKSLSATVQAREDYLNSCTSVECKYEMLGSFATLFTKEEIEGVADKASVQVGDLARQNAHQGLSAKTLYRKLLLKLKEQVNKGQMQDDFIEPWTGQAAKLPKNFNELIDSMLAKMGVTHTSCFTPMVLAEMRCYAFFAVLDPTLVAGATLKVASVSGRAARLERGLEKLAVADKVTPDIPMVWNDELVRRMKQITTIAKRKNFDADPYVEMVSYKIAAGRSGVSYRDKSVALSAQTAMEGDRFTVKIISVEANPDWKSRYLGLTVAGREAGLNSTMAKTFYTTVKGAAMAAKANPEIKVIRIHADHVINSSLKKNLTEVGFVSLKTKEPIKDKQISGHSPQTLVFEVPVEKLAELGF